jgi:hypothetical protein
MNIQSLFQTEAERKEAQEQLLSLKEYPAWQFLCEKVIKTYIDDITANILNRDYIWEGTEENEAKRIREHWILLKELPEKILATLVEEPKKEPVSDDPYAKTLKELNRKSKS